MSTLHVIFDGYHMQTAFQAATERPVRVEEIQILRNAIVQVMRQSAGQGFHKLNTRFVTGCVGPLVTDPEFRLIVERNTCALTEETIESIVIVFHELIPAPGNRYKQPEWLCDGDIVTAIDAARPGDYIAISTVDGGPITMPDGSTVDGIAAALDRADKNGAVIWLFTFDHAQQTPAPRLRELIPSERRVVGQFITSGEMIDVKMALKSPVISASLPFSLNRADWEANGRSYVR